MQRGTLVIDGTGIDTVPHVVDFGVGIALDEVIVRNLAATRRPILTGLVDSVTTVTIRDNPNLSETEVAQLLSALGQTQSVVTCGNRDDLPCD
jgi:hypothetical protein